MQLQQLTPCYPLNVLEPGHRLGTKKRFGIETGKRVNHELQYSVIRNLSIGILPELDEFQRIKVNRSLMRNFAVAVL
jgi:hypothetical protein